MLEEVLINKWRETGLLDKLHEDKVKDMVYALEGQKVFLEQVNFSIYPKFKLCIIPIVRRFLENKKYTIGPPASPIVTDVVWAGEETYGFDAVAEYTLQVVSELNSWLNGFSFSALGLVDGKIAIY